MRLLANPHVLVFSYETCFSWSSRFLFFLPCDHGLDDGDETTKTVTTNNNRNDCPLLSTIHQRTQVDDRYKHPAAPVAIISDSNTILPYHGHTRAPLPDFPTRTLGRYPDEHLYNSPSKGRQSIRSTSEYLSFQPLVHL